MSRPTPLHRRAFLRFVAGSPLLSLLGLPACSGQRSDRSARGGAARELAQRIASPDEAINVFDFQVVPCALTGKVSSGSTCGPAAWWT
jgi:hypothetical protein